MLVGVDDQQHLAADEGVGEPGSGRCGLGLVEGAAVEEAAVLVVPVNPSVRLTYA